MDVTLTYSTDGVSVTSQTFDAMLVKGFDPIDSWATAPGLFSKLLSGDNRNRLRVFNRTYQVNIGVLTDWNDRLFIGRYVIAPYKYLTYAHNQITESSVQVELVDPSVFETEWAGGSELRRYVRLEVVERNSREDFPTSGIIIDDNLYLVQNVIVIGTEDDPEEFITGTDKLATLTAPVGGSWPTFNLVTNKAHVDVNGARYGTGVRQVGIPTESGGNLHFFLAADNTGNPAPDGYNRADILISVV